MGTEAPGIASLDADACWKLLGSAEVGRLAVSVAGRPDIFPVNYVVEQGTIVFCTAEGTKLAATLINGAVAFECDGEAEDDAWSVVVKGHAKEVAMHDLVDQDAFALYPWSATAKTRFVRVVPEEITGRRFHIAQRRPS